MLVFQRSATVARSASVKLHAREREDAASVCALAVTALQSHANVRTRRSAAVLPTAASAPNVVSSHTYISTLESRISLWIVNPFH